MEPQWFTVNEKYSTVHGRPGRTSHFFPAMYGWQEEVIHSKVFIPALMQVSLSRNKEIRNEFWLQCTLFTLFHIKYNARVAQSAKVPVGSFSATSCLLTQVDLPYLLQNKEVLLPPFSLLQWKPRLSLRHSLTSLSYSEKPRIFHSVTMYNKSLPPLFFVSRELHAQYQHFLNTRRNLCIKISEKTTQISAVYVLIVKHSKSGTIIPANVWGMHTAHAPCTIVRLVTLDSLT